MMEPWTLMLWALGMGIVTALHPCPFSTISVASGLFVSLGRSGWRMLAFCVGSVAAFTVIGAVVTTSLATIPSLSAMIPRVSTPFLGPLLILAGMLQADLIRLPEAWRLRMTGRWKDSGIFGCFLGGGLLACAFCPATAGLFFAVVIPAAMTSGYTVLPATMYGLGFALVPAGMMIVMGLGSKRLDRTGTQRFSTVLTMIASSILIIGGIYFTFKHTF